MSEVPEGGRHSNCARTARPVDVHPAGIGTDSFPAGVEFELAGVQRKVKKGWADIHVYIYINTYRYMYTCIYTYIYIYIQRDA